VYALLFELKYTHVRCLDSKNDRYSYTVTLNMSLTLFNSGCSRGCYCTCRILYFGVVAFPRYTSVPYIYSLSLAFGGTSAPKSNYRPKYGVEPCYVCTYF
jgi:hypothetical protein